MRSYTARNIFIVLMLVYTVSTIFSSTQAPIADSYAIVAANRAGATYGSIRMMMSIGAAVGAIAGGTVCIQVLRIKHLAAVSAAE
ncbi:hypothetical protein ACFTAO_12380 [Paenibacillus rhizoplanae]